MVPTKEYYYSRLLHQALVRVIIEVPGMKLGNGKELVSFMMSAGAENQGLRFIRAFSDVVDQDETRLVNDV